jgi:hypothetical protein
MKHPVIAAIRVRIATGVTDAGLTTAVTFVEALHRSMASSTEFEGQG